MMFKRQYHYLIAGLADLSFDSGKGFAAIADFREELKTMLYTSDYSLVSIFFLPHDNKNLLAFMEGKTGEWDTLGNYSLQDMEEQKRIIDSILKEDDILPAYMVESMKNWFYSEKKSNRSEIERKLTEGYINIALTSGNRFLEKYTRFDRDMRNIFIFINSKTLGLDPVKFIAGDDPLANQLREVLPGGKGFNIPLEPEYVPGIFKIVMENEFLDREMKSDIARWDYVNEATFFEYFTIDWILGYLIKLSIVTRWKQLDPGLGKMMLDRLIADLEAPVKKAGYGDE